MGNKNGKDEKKNEEKFLFQDAYEKLENWKKEQDNFKNNLSNEDSPLVHDIIYIGGLSISYMIIKIKCRYKWFNSLRL